MAWILLGLAIAVELCATAGLKLSDGFTRPGITAGVLAGYGLSFLLLSRAVEAGMQVSIGYAVWSGIGTAALALVGAAFLEEPLSLGKALGIGLVAGGVVLLALADRA